MVRIRIEDIEKYAEENDIPIMEKEGIEFLTDYIKENNIKTILEIGSAIGYSAIKMALVNPYIKITTIEKDKKRFKIAKKYIRKLKLKKQIKIVFDDALKSNVKEKFDLIFIDAAKGQYINFFEKFKTNLNDNGVIVTDNLNFHGLVERDEKEFGRNLRGLIKRIKNYREYLENNIEFKTEYYNIGDGITISKKVE